MKYLKAISKTLIEIGKSKVDYENPSSDDNYGVPLEKSPDSCFVDDYFNGVKLALKANVDIYTVCYQSKKKKKMKKDELSYAKSQAMMEVWKKKSNKYSVL